jgi:hypothetical protein
VAYLLQARILLEKALFNPDERPEALERAIADGWVAFDKADQIVKGKNPAQDGTKDGCRRYRVDVLYANVLLLLVEDRLAASRRDRGQPAQLEEAAQEKLREARTIAARTHYCILNPDLDRISQLLGGTGGL